LKTGLYVEGLEKDHKKGTAKQGIKEQMAITTVSVINPACSNRAKRKRPVKAIITKQKKANTHSSH